MVLTLNKMENLLKEIKSIGYNLNGLTSTQIREIEDFYNVKLPKEYIYFLKSMGKDGGGFLRGEDVFIDRIFELREYANDLLTEDESDFILKPEHFVFYSHQGYIFAFFDTLNYDEDSSIYFYFEGDLKPTVKYKSFKHFLKDRVKSQQSTDTC